MLFQSEASFALIGFASQEEALQHGEKIDEWLKLSCYVYGQAGARLPKGYEWATPIFAVMRSLVSPKRMRESFKLELVSSGVLPDSNGTWRASVVIRILELPVLDYTSSTAPKDYRCMDCRARGVRLWADDSPKAVVLCTNCAESREQRSHPEGWVSDWGGGQGNTIGKFVPAIPDERYTCFLDPPPFEGVNWWLRLPLIP